MEDDQPQVTTPETPPVETSQAATPQSATPQETPSEPTLAQVQEAAKAKAEAESSKREAQKEGRPQGSSRPPREPRGDRPPRPQGDRPQGDRPQGGPRRDDRRPERGPGDRGPGGRPEGRPGGGRPFEGFAADIELEKLISDSLYLDNQAHAVVARMRDMDSGTKSQLRRLYNAVRRAVRAPESDRQHQFVMLRARLAYTIARHSAAELGCAGAVAASGDSQERR